eukprot:GILJ01000849.1.p1 GENE.GILJ01000849.1~~GILJ01000849.1.p1  ORF type:complete len:1036 (+),score=164.47 GILJ01000849.1:81-3188(+)
MTAMRSSGQRLHTVRVLSALFAFLCVVLLYRSVWHGLTHSLICAALAFVSLCVIPSFLPGIPASSWFFSFLLDYLFLNWVLSNHPDYRFAAAIQVAALPIIAASFIQEQLILGLMVVVCLFVQHSHLSDLELQTISPPCATSFFGSCNREMALIFTLITSVMIFMDKRNRLEESAQFQQLYDKAQEASRAKDAFIGLMSHEIRNPLNCCLGCLDLLLDSPATPEQQQLLRMAKDTGDVLMTLLNNVLDLSKLDADMMALDLIPTNLMDVFAKVKSIYSTTCSMKGLVFELEMDSTIPQAVVCDSARVLQVLVNLVSNAIKFTEKGYVKLSATWTTKDELNGVLTVEVSDSGIGMPKAAIEKLFTKFQQADATISRQFGGSGLGLYISKQILQLMGGSIGCCSSVNRGTQFRAKIPLTVYSIDAPVSTSFSIQQPPSATLSSSPASSPIAHSLTKSPTSVMNLPLPIVPAICDGHSELSLFPADVSNQERVVSGVSGCCASSHTPDSEGILIPASSWGTHVCQFYYGREQLVSLLGPYFLIGLENKEYCMLIVSEGVVEDTLRAQFPALNAYIEAGHMKILNYLNFYMKDGYFDSNRCLEMWMDEVKWAFNNGYNGLRCSGDLRWAVGDPKLWNQFLNYEREIQAVIGMCQMTAVCTYPLNAFPASDIVEVMQAHQYTVMQTDDTNWEKFELSKQTFAGAGLPFSSISTAPSSSLPSPVNSSSPSSSQSSNRSSSRSLLPPSASSSARVLSSGNVANDKTAIVSQLQEMRILIVDDNDFNREVFVRLLQKWSSRIETASNGRIALDMLQKQEYDVVLLDLQMPEIDGYGVMDSYHLYLRRAVRKRAAIVVVTGNATSDHKELCFEYGVRAFLPKPASSHTLYAALSDVVLHPARNWKILLVDDDPMSQHVVRQFLLKHEYVVTVASDGQEAVSLYQQTLFDVVLMDCEMPVMDGYKATEAIRGWEAQQGFHKRPIVGLSGHPISDMSPHTIKCKEVGMTHLLQKPIGFEALGKVVETILHSHGKQPVPLAGFARQL